MGPRDFADLPQARAIAEALRRAYDELGASTCTAYLLSDDQRALVAAMTVDTPLSFSVPTSFDVDDVTWPTVRSFQAGKTIVFGEDQKQERFLPTRGLISMSLSVAPIRTSRIRYGAIALRWIPSKTVETDGSERLQQIADHLADEFEALVSRGSTVAAPLVPVFIPPRSELPTRELGVAQSVVQELTAKSTTRGSYLHQLQRLAAELTAASRTEDILAIAQARVVRPFGGKALTVCVVEEERLHVVGAVGVKRQAVRYLEGTPLSQRAPETDAINLAHARIFPSANALKREYPDTEAEFAGESIGFFPLIRGGRAMGCCVVEFAGSRRPLAAAEAALLAMMLEHVGQSLGRARSQEVQHALARSIQRSLLPRTFPHVPELVATARYLPVTEGVEVGGDWYDVLALPDGRIGFVIGDVEGHNLAAAAVMGQLRSAVRAYAAEGHEPAALLEQSNRLLMGLGTELYATCCCAWLDVESGVALIAGAGHPMPLISNEPGEVAQPDLPVEPPLGVTAQYGYHQHAVRLRFGSVIAFFTDGLLSSRELGGDIALQRLERLLADRGGEDLELLADRLVGDSHTQSGFKDDAALVLVRYEGAQRRETPRVARMNVERGDLRGVAEVRLFLDDLLGRWSRDSVVDDIKVMASEMVTNALIHARSGVDFRLREYPDRIRVEVQDSDPNPPIPTTLLEDETRNEQSETGRGLLIVDALALAWGSSPAGRGKITWFEVGFHEAESREPALTGTFDAPPL